MSKFAAFIFILVLRILYQPSGSKKDIAPFTTPSHLQEPTSQFIPAKQNNAGESIYNEFISPDKKDNEGGTANNLKLLTSKID